MQDSWPCQQYTDQAIKTPGRPCEYKNNTLHMDHDGPDTLLLVHLSILDAADWLTRTSFVCKAGLWSLPEAGRPCRSHVPGLL